MFRSPAKQHSSTPDLPSLLETDTPNITQRKRKHPECDSELSDLTAFFTSELNGALSNLTKLMNEKLSEINKNIISVTLDINTLKSTTMEIKEELNSIRTEHHQTKKRVSLLEEKQGHLTDSVGELKLALQYNSDTYSDLQKQVKCLESRSHSLDADALNRLDTKIEYLEQQARQCNIELCNVPEKKGENLLVLMEKLGSYISYPITKTDIVTVHRVPHAQKEITRPKNIIVKFSTRVTRDNILSAFRLKKKVSSDDIGLSGTSHRLYLNEHLTLDTKRLFRECRQAAQKHNYKYVWVKNSTILVRENDTAPALAIRNHQDIAIKIKSQRNNSCERKH